MKQIKDLVFPYPILQEDDGDYNSSIFSVNVEVNKIVQNEKKAFEIIAIPTLKCPFIEKLIAEGEAVLALHIEQRTFRQVYQITDKPIVVYSGYLSPNHNLEIVGLVIATKDLSFEYDSSMKEQFSYFGEPFTCEKGSILAFSNFMEFELPTDEKISSIFTISEYKDPADISKEDPYKIDLTGQVIDISVMPKTKEYFCEIRNSRVTENKLLNSIFVYPAIQTALVCIFNDYDSVKDYKWCIAITNKIAGAKECSIETLLESNLKGIDKDELTEYTHIILEDLITSAFEEANNGGND